MSLVERGVMVTDGSKRIHFSLPDHHVVIVGAGFATHVASLATIGKSVAVIDFWMDQNPRQDCLVALGGHTHLFPDRPAQSSRRFVELVMDLRQWRSVFKRLWLTQAASRFEQRVAVGERLRNVLKMPVALAMPYMSFSRSLAAESDPG